MSLSRKALTLLGVGMVMDIKGVAKNRQSGLSEELYHFDGDLQTAIRNRVVTKNLLKKAISDVDNIDTLECAINELQMIEDDLVMAQRLANEKREQMEMAEAVPANEYDGEDW